MKFDQSFKHKFGIDQFLNVDFTSESLDIEMPNNLYKSALDCLEKCRDTKGLPDSDKVFDRFLELLNGYRAFFGGQVGKVEQSVAKFNFFESPGKKVKF